MPITFSTVFKRAVLWTRWGLQNLFMYKEAIQTRRRQFCAVKWCIGARVRSAFYTYQYLQAFVAEVSSKERLRRLLSPHQNHIRAPLGYINRLAFVQKQTCGAKLTITQCGLMLSQLYIIPASHGAFANRSRTPCERRRWLNAGRKKLCSGKAFKFKLKKQHLVLPFFLIHLHPRDQQALIELHFFRSELT